MYSTSSGNHHSTDENVDIFHRFTKLSPLQQVAIILIPILVIIALLILLLLIICLIRKTLFEKQKEIYSFTSSTCSSSIPSYDSEESMYASSSYSTFPTTSSITSSENDRLSINMNYLKDSFSFSSGIGMGTYPAKFSNNLTSPMTEYFSCEPESPRFASAFMRLPGPHMTSLQPSKHAIALKPSQSPIVIDNAETRHMIDTIDRTFDRLCATLDICFDNQPH